MASYGDQLVRAMRDSMQLARRLHEDSTKARIIFEAMKKNIDFETLVEQNSHRSEEFLEEARSFGQVLHDWSVYYPNLIKDYRRVLALVFRELEQIQGLRIVRSGLQVSVHFNEREFVFNFRENLPYEGGGELVISDADKEILAEKEHKAVEDIVHVIEFDLRLERFIQFIETVSERRYNLAALSANLEGIQRIDDPQLLRSLHKIFEWWTRVSDVFEKIREVTYKAFKIDKKVQKDVRELLYEEELKHIKDKKIRLAKLGGKYLAGMVLAILPGAAKSTIGWLLEGKGRIKDCKDMWREARELANMPVPD